MAKLITSECAVPSVEEAPCVRERLLDAAERLFALNGIAETSVRAITNEAGANVAAINYYFGSRSGLFQEVVARRLAALDQKRKQLLEGFRTEAGGNPTVEDVLYAFAAPSIELAFEYPYFARLISQLRLNNDRSLWQDYRASRMEQMQIFQTAFMMALPQLSAKEVETRLHYIIGAIHHIWSHCPFVDEETPPQMLESFIVFYAAGLRASVSEFSTTCASVLETRS
jgi:AcrR family transcriptional regulator